VALVKSNRSRSARPLIVVSAFALALAGCSADDGASQSPTPGPSTAAPTIAPSGPASDESPSAGSADAGALLRVGERALQEVPESTLVSIETERDGTVWEVQLVLSDGSEYEVELSADGETVVGQPRAKDESAADRAKHQDRVKAATLDYRAAVQRILEIVPGGRITELDLDSENGVTVWEADVRDQAGAKHPVVIDAGDGRTIRG